MWGQLVIDSLVRPRKAARRILEAGLALEQLLQGAIIGACVWSIVVVALWSIPGIRQVLPAGAGPGSPLLGAAAQVGETALVAFLTSSVGRLFGGIGRFQGALALVVWLQLVFVMAVAVLLGLFFALPALALPLLVCALVASAAGTWSFANFVAELHAFPKPVIVLGAVVLTTIMLMLGTQMLLAILGVIPQEAS